MYNKHTRGMVTTRHRSLVERGGRKAFASVRDNERAFCSYFAIAAFHTKGVNAFRPRACTHSNVARQGREHIQTLHAKGVNAFARRAIAA